MKTTHDQFSSVSAMLRERGPVQPVYAIYPEVYRQTAQAFLGGFPGRVLYAVKANDEPAVLKLLHEAGVRHYDCASLPEVALVSECCPGATCYFMVPVALPGAAADAQRIYGLRHFMIDHAQRLEQLEEEIDLQASVVFARMAVSHKSSMMDLSSKFGAPPDEIPVLLQRIADSGAEPALAFNVGSLVTDPAAYRHALSVAAECLDRLPFRVRLVDIGGGFPRSYPGFPVPAMEAFFDAVCSAAAALPMAADGELLAEPGRALAAPGLSAVVRVLLRKDGRLYLNDGMYGIFWELRFKAHKRFAVRVFRDGALLEGETEPFGLYGPTCDATDVLPAEVDLPRQIRPGDYLEFGNIGAYSLAGRTRFNGHYSDSIIEISSSADRPPGIDAIC